MIDHFALLLDAYLDNELPPSKVCLVEQHLKTCLHCQGELKKRRQLVALLHEAPPAKIVESDAQFFGKVSSQLKVRPSNRWQPRSILSLGWQVIPVGLLMLMAFIYTVSFISTITEYIPGVNEMILGKFTWLEFDFSMMEPLNIILWIFEPLRISHWNWVSGIVALSVISLIYISWLIVWWFQYKSTNAHRMVY